MYEHHRQTIENLKACYEKDNDCLALIVIGSVARGEAGQGSDVDFYLVVNEQAYEDCLAENGECVDAHEYSVSPCTEANGYLITKPALKVMREHGLDITYRYQNYLELTDENQYDAALLIYGDFCPLSSGQRALLLQNVYRALNPGGFFVLDVSTRECRKQHSNRNGWRALASGFWKPGPHLLLEDGFDYPAQSIWLDQAVVIEENGKISVYRNWFQDYTPETITAELQAGGFDFESLWGDLTGKLYTDGSEWIGLVTRKM